MAGETRFRGHAAAQVADSTVSSTGSVEEALNEKAVAVINRVKEKLSGRDFANTHVLGVKEQVERLLEQAGSHENLCQCYIGWCAFW